MADNSSQPAAAASKPAGQKAQKQASPPVVANKTVVFLHPDLGIGGAERLVIDAAVGLQKRGHRVVIFTSHCDPKHCFDEARDGTLDVRVRGASLVPTSLLGRFAILCAILRQLHLVLSIALFTSELANLKPSVLFVDQLSANLPLLKWLASKPLFFYCHFPDKLLARGRESVFKRAYRLPFDVLEEFSMEFADAVAVNSEFTRGVVAATWHNLVENTDVRVVYPSVGLEDGSSKEKADEVGPLWRDKRVLLSINRFERKKDVALAIKAFAALPTEKRKDARLVIAGGYDPRVTENRQYHAELESLASDLKLSHASARTLSTALAIPPATEVLFFLSAPNAAKQALLHSASLLLYTPSNEHFGIVPLEAMRAGTPVLAADNGGPTETVEDGVTGWLRDPEDVPAWTGIIEKVLDGMSAAERAKMGEAGRERVRTRFAEGIMAERLDGIFDQIMDRQRDKPGNGEGEPLDMVVVVTAVVIAVGSTVAIMVISRL